MTDKPKTVDEYIASKPRETQVRLEELRSYLKLADPTAIEELKWGKPAFVRDGVLYVLVGSVYGRRMYEVMRYWDDDHPEWSADEHAFAAAWRKQPKWVASRSLKSVGPNAKLIEESLERTT